MQGKGFTKINPNRSSVLLIAAFAAIYIFWGSTYLAIKYALETLPPFLMVGVRFVSAGTILLVWARFSKDYEPPKPAHWRTSFIVGMLLLLGGNGGVVFAERHLSSSRAALLVATEPFWIVLLSWLWLKGARPKRKVALGLALGFFDVWLLISGQDASDVAHPGSMQLFGTIAVIMSKQFCRSRKSKKRLNFQKADARAVKSFCSRNFDSINLFRFLIFISTVFLFSEMKEKSFI